MSDSIGGTVERGQVMSLIQRSAWRCEYQMRAGERALGWLRWQPGRRSFARPRGGHRGRRSEWRIGRRSP